MKRLVLILPILLLVPFRASAMRIAPTIFDVVANPGETLTEEISFTNDQAAAVTLTPEVVNFGRKDDAAPGIPDFYPASETRDGNELAPWMAVDPKPFTVLPRETFKVAVSISVPAGAEPGSRFGAVIFRTGGGSGEGASVGLSSGAAALFFLRVNGQVVESLQMESFTTGQRLYAEVPVDFSARFHNPGTVHQRPTGRFSIISMFGKGVLDTTFNPELAAIMPGSRRRFDLRWDGAPGHLPFGKYVATLVVKYGPENSTIGASTEFWVIPRGTTGLLAGGIGGLILLLALLLRRRRPRPKRKR